MATAAHTTDYQSTFIAVADDCPVATGQVPPLNPAKPSIAALQFAMLIDNPYELTSDDVLFGVHAIRTGIATEDMPAARDEFFAKPKACFRSSPLTKRYGWGVHYDSEGRMALVAAGSDTYALFAADTGLKQLKAMRSQRTGN